MRFLMKRSSVLAITSIWFSLVPGAALTQESSGELDPTVVTSAEANPVPRPLPRRTPVAAPSPDPAPSPVINDEAPQADLEPYGSFAPASTTALGFDLELKEVPATVSSVTSEFLDSSQTDRLRDALQFIPGITVNDDGGWTNDGILVRGFSGAGYYIDGLKQNAANPRPAFETVEQIDVLKGAAGAEFGVAEPGGVINIVTKKPFEGRLYELESSVGNYGYNRHSIDFNDTLSADGSVKGRLIAAWGESAEWRKGRKDNNNIYDYVIAPSVLWDYSDKGSLLFSFERNYQADPQDRGIIFLDGAFPGGFAPRDWSWHQNNAEQVNENNRFTTSINHEISDDLVFRGTYEFSDYDYILNEHRNADSEPGFGTPDVWNPDGLSWSGVRSMNAYFDMWSGDRITHNFRGELEKSFSTGQIDHDLAVGVRYYNTGENGRFESPTVVGNSAVNVLTPQPNVLSSNVTALGAPYLATNTISETGFYTRWLAEVNPRLRTLVSTQYVEFNSNYYGTASDSETLSIRAALSYDLTDIHTAFFGVSDAYAPQGGATRSGTAVDPTHDQSVEFGVKTSLFDGRALWTNSVFQTDRADIVASDPTNTGTESFVINFGEVEITGFESEFVGRINDELNLRFGFALLDSEIIETDLGPFAGNPFANAAEFQATAFADYNLARLGLPKWTATAGVVHIGDRPGNSGGTIILPEYTVLDAGLRCEVNESTELYVFASNLFDETYYLSMQDSGNRADQIDVGDRQLFRFGVKKRF